MATGFLAGKVNGPDVIGMYELLSADKPVFIVMVRWRESKADVEKIINSIKNGRVSGGITDYPGLPTRGKRAAWTAALSV